MEFEGGEILEAVSPSGQYLSSSLLSLTILGILEIEIPIDDSQTHSLLTNLFLPINPRFSSIMVGEKSSGVKKWKKVEVNVKEHVNVAILPENMPLEFYDEYLENYLSNLGINPLPHNRPLWEVHIFKYPTSNAAGTLIFKLHHSLGDGFSLMGALLSCLKRIDNPLIPLTFPSRQSTKPSSKPADGRKDVFSLFKRVPQVLSRTGNTLFDFGYGLLKSSVLKDVESPIRSGQDGVEFLPRRMITTEFSLDQIKLIKNNLNVSINDLIVGVILLGTRLYMEGENSNTGESNLNALVLLNTRNLEGYKSISEMVKPKSTMPWGNHFAFLHLPIPKLVNTESSNPLDFVYETQNTIKRKRNSAAVFLTGILLENLRKIRGPEATSKYIYNTLLNSSITITNLIGPVEKMSLSDHPVKGLYFFVVGAPQSIELTVISYVGKLRMGIGVQKDFIDPHKLKSCIAKAFTIISEASSASCPIN